MAARVACAARALTFRARAPRVRGLGTHGVVGDAPRWSNIARCSPPALAFPSSPAPTASRELPRALPRPRGRAPTRPAPGAVAVARGRRLPRARFERPDARGRA